MALAALALAGAAGCAGWRDSAPMKVAKLVDIPSGIPWDEERQPTGVPMRIVAAWTDAVRSQPGKKSERGFGGRLYFYGKDPKMPLRVDGTLVVYAFDETDRLPTDNKPTRRYVFPPETFKVHESESEFGVSYSVWLPWDEAGGSQTDVSLIARFDPVNGSTMAMSDQARERLPGKLGAEFKQQMLASQLKKEGASRSGEAIVAQANYQAPSGEIRGAGVETTTISVPDNSRVAESLTRGGGVVTYQSVGDSVRQARGLAPHGTAPAARRAPGASAAPKQGVH